MSKDVISVVIPALNEGAYLPYTVYWILRNGALQDLEIIVVDDGSTDGSVSEVRRLFGAYSQLRVIEGEKRGPGRARNLGGLQAQGEILVFIDAHCYTPPGWLEALTAPLKDPAIGLVGCALANLHQPEIAHGLGCTWNDASLDLVWLPGQSDKPYPVPLLPGGCQAIRASDFLSFGQYDPGMSHIGSEGEEQALRCWLMGYSVVVHPAVVVHHYFRDQPPYAVRSGELIHNRLRLASMHFSSERVARVIDALKWSEHFSTAMADLLASDITDRRIEWQTRRTRSDDWFFERFGLAV